MFYFLRFQFTKFILGVTVILNLFCSFFHTKCNCYFLPYLCIPHLQRIYFQKKIYAVASNSRIKKLILLQIFLFQIILFLSALHPVLLFPRSILSGHVIDPYPQFVFLKQRYRISQIRFFQRFFSSLDNTGHKETND